MLVETGPCFECGEHSIIEIPEELIPNYEQWSTSHMFIQDAFPTWSASQREHLKTGIHPECWDKMFAVEES
jgi:hypothetical protein